LEQKSCVVPVAWSWLPRELGFRAKIAPVNPALAAMANALRVGDHLLTRLD
jgi:hypothetical protein